MASEIVKRDLKFDVEDMKVSSPSFLTMVEDVEDKDGFESGAFLESVMYRQIK